MLVLHLQLLQFAACWVGLTSAHDVEHLLAGLSVGSNEAVRTTIAFAKSGKGLMLFSRRIW